MNNPTEIVKVADARAAGLVTSTRLLMALAIAATPLAHAATYSVGPGADGCTHVSLESALATAVTAPSGPHRIKLRAGSDHLLTSALSVSQPVADLEIVGGYASCGSSVPDAGAVATIRRDPAVASTSLLGITNAIANPRRSLLLSQVVLRDGVTTAALTGGGVTVLGAATLIVGRGAVIRNNRANAGGGIYLLSFGSTEEQLAQVVLRDGGRVQANDAVAVPSGQGGGIYALGGARVTVENGSILQNRARTDGGGVYLSGTGAQLRLWPVGGQASPPVEFNLNKAGARAFDPGAAFETNRGRGGAIHLTGGASLISWSQVTTDRRPAILMTLNEANFGGAIQATGQTTEFSTAVLVNAHVLGNYAYGKGGAFHVLNAVDFTFRSGSAGPCAPVQSGEGRAPCARAIWNMAENDTYPPESAGGGVVYVDTEAGASRAIFRSGGALYALNEDINGTAAVAAAVANGSKLSFVRSIFDGNVAGSPSATFGAMLESYSATDGITFRFNTVREQEVRHLLYTAAGNHFIHAHGSIFWQGTGTPITNMPAAGKVVPGEAGNFCLNLHNAHMSELSTFGPGITVNPPRLDHEHAPRPRGPIDRCASSSGDTHYPAAVDAWGRATDVDVASIPDWLGPVDMGAIEQYDLIMHAGFGNYPAN